MADESVRVTNMPELGSREMVAFKLWESLQYALPDNDDWKARINMSLDLYNTCLSAASYRRKTEIS